MDQDLSDAIGETIDTMLGPGGAGDDAGIMASQLRRAGTILTRPPLALGSLFATEPATFTARLDHHAVAS